LVSLTEFGWLEETLALVRARVLTNGCRDPQSRNYGCFDRNWWHYRIVDFPSVILQQASETLECLSGSSVAAESDALRDLAAAGTRFWATRATRRGAFEEYYPNERSFPALAFSTLAICNVLLKHEEIDSQVHSGLRAASSQLVQRSEHYALNQELAAIAALARLQQLDSSLVKKQIVIDRLEQALAQQSPEGWFPEYYGADTGYLSVSLDCLWEIQDSMPEMNTLDARISAFAYLHQVVTSGIPSLATINSRNTDYIVPYGIARSLSVPELQSPATELLNKLGQGTVMAPKHFTSVDDRYSCHYVGRSIAKAWQFISEISLPPRSLGDSSPSKRVESFPDAGVVRLVDSEAREPETKVWVACRKGANLTGVLADGGSLIDHGWRVKTRSSTYVSDWCTDGWRIERIDATSVTVSGGMIGARDVASTPIHHFFLRVAASLMGRRLIPLLKHLLILKSSGSGPTFTRTVSISGDVLIVEDSIAPVSADALITRAGRQSLRHVASADSFHSTDLQPIENCLMTQEVVREPGRFTAQTSYSTVAWKEPCEEC